MTISIKGTFKFTAIICAVAATATLPLTVSGRWLPFAFGLICGTGAAMVGFAAVYRLTERAADTGSRGAAFAGIALRFLIYFGVMAVATAMFGLWSGVGSAVGCLTAPLAIIFQNTALPKLRRARGLSSSVAASEKREYIYEPHMRGADGALRYVFMRGSYMEAASKGRVYMTHRRFRKLAAIRVVDAKNRDGEGPKGSGHL